MIGWLQSDTAPAHAQRKCHGVDIKSKSQVGFPSLHHHHLLPPDPPTPPTQTSSHSCFFSPEKRCDKFKHTFKKAPGSMFEGVHESSSAGSKMAESQYLNSSWSVGWVNYLGVSCCNVKSIRPLRFTNDYHLTWSLTFSFLLLSSKKWLRTFEDSFYFWVIGCYWFYIMQSEPLRPPASASNIATFITFSNGVVCFLTALCQWNQTY